MATSKAKRVQEQLPAVFNFIADAIEDNPMLHFDAALEQAHYHFDDELTAMLGSVVRYMSLGMTVWEALKLVADQHRIPAFHHVVTVIIQTHQPDGSFITADTLRRAVAQLDDL